jgi:hypothetical protein
MKKLLICFGFSLMGYIGYSQVSFGVKSGINIATTKDLYAFPKNRIGWYAGGFATIPLFKKFFLQSELLYSTKGNGFNQINPLGAPNGVYRFNYLNLPILFGYKIDRKTAIFFGPELGYLTEVREVYSRDENFNNSNSFPPKFDAGLDVGLNYKILKKLGIEVRYNYGFNTLYEVDAVGNRHGDGINGANRVFQIGLNYIFQN